MEGAATAGVDWKERELLLGQPVSSSSVEAAEPLAVEDICGACMGGMEMGNVESGVDGAEALTCMLELVRDDMRNFGGACCCCSCCCWTDRCGGMKGGL